MFTVSICYSNCLFTIYPIYNALCLPEKIAHSNKCDGWALGKTRDFSPPRSWHFDLNRVITLQGSPPDASRHPTMLEHLTEELALILSFYMLMPYMNEISIGYGAFWK